VPSGSGGIINFNNGRHREAMFEAPVYGVDYLTTFMHPQVVQPTRLPVLGIQNNNAAMLAHVYSGQALATVMADVSGRTNSYNNAWFRFLLRSSMTLNMSAIPGTTTSDLTIVQRYPYTGDISVMYHFIENAGIGEMAKAYQEFLISEGALTPLSENRDRSLYLDIIGGVDVQRHILGTPFIGIETMTTMQDANRFVDILNENEIETIQMSLHGWFNRGVNHDVAKNVRPINSVGSRAELQALNSRLQSENGGLFPAVNFKSTNWFSRNINRTFEAARDAGGFYGFMTHVSRDSLSSRFGQHLNAFSLLIHPAVLPMHIDAFLPAFEKNAPSDGIMFTDLGDILTESLYMRNAVDREHSRLIAMSQMRRIRGQIPNIIVSGGNDYSLAFASHIVDAPTEADMFMIIDYEVPFFSMVVHGFLEFAGAPANMRENFHPDTVLLNSMATGASPRYIISAQPTRHAQSSPHERFYSTQFENWIDTITNHYRAFNDVYRGLRAERIVDFIILQGGEIGITGTNQVTATVFSNGTRIYVNQTHEAFDTGKFVIGARSFVVRDGNETLPNDSATNDFVYENFFDFDGDGTEKRFTIREIETRDIEMQRYWDTTMLFEVWSANNDTLIWEKELAIFPECEQSFAVQKVDGKAYFVYTRISHSDWGYRRTDDFYSMTDGCFEEIKNFHTVWNELTPDPYSNDYILDEQKRFYINDAAVTEQEYQNTLGDFGLELIYQRHENDNGFKWYTSEIYFSNPIYIGGDA
jgi:hypothetical protein